MCVQVVTRTGSTLRDGALFIRMASLARQINPEVCLFPEPELFSRYLQDYFTVTSTYHSNYFLS